MRGAEPIRAGGTATSSRNLAVHPSAGSRLRVLQVISRLAGGPAAQVCYLAGRLPAERYDTIVAAGEPGSDEVLMTDLRTDLRSEIEGRLVPIPSLVRAVRPRSDAAAFRALDSLVRQFRPHIVHSHGAKAGTIGRAVAVRRRVPLSVHTFHGTVFEGHFGPAASRGIALWERALAMVTDAVIAVSPAVAAQLSTRAVARSKTVVIELGLALDDMLRVPPARMPAPVLALVARLVPVKDVPLFLRAFDIARRSRPELQAKVLGDGFLRAELEATAPQNVTFLGDVPDVASELATCGAVALTSRSEGSPVAVIEALAAARPVASVPIAAATELLDGLPGAVIARDRTPEAVAAAMLEALSPSRSAAAAETRERIAERFSVERLIDATDDLYTSLWRSKR